MKEKKETKTLTNGNVNFKFGDFSVNFFLNKIYWYKIVKIIRDISEVQKSVLFKVI